MQYIYSFFDQSSGNPNRWSWDFGDQAVSTQQNPIHQFNASGTYNVCLTITSDTFGYSCTDDTCMTIIVPGFYDLGGFAFAGNYPINNPNPTGDTAIAFLYRIDDFHIIPVRSMIFSDLGYYWFSGLTEGTYLVKIQLLPNTTHYDAYLPAYYQDAMEWRFASPISLNEGSIYDADVHLTSTVVKPGPGMISGTIRLDTAVYDDMVFSPANAEILLFDEAGMPMQSQFSDENGIFVFSDLAFANYKLMAEMAGFVPVISSVTLNPDNILVNNVVLTVYEHGSYGIEDLTKKLAFKLENLYPDPVNDVLYLAVSSETGMRVTVTIYNELAQQSQRLSFGLQKGRQILHVNVDPLNKGLFILMISTPDGLALQTKKFIK
jgi:PKD repeat protein